MKEETCELALDDPILFEYVKGILKIKSFKDNRVFG